MNKAAILILAGLLVSCGGSPESAVGEKIYNERCGGCHNSIESQAPMLGALKQMPVSRILRTLDFGVMMNVAYPLNRDQREAVAEWLGVPDEKAAAKPVNYCANRMVVIHELAPTDWAGWSPGAANARYQPDGGLSAANLGRLKLKWVFGFEGDVNSFAPPTVIGETLFAGSAGGFVHALDRRTGCVKWLYQADGPVRNPPAVAFIGPRHVLLFGDQTGWFYALEAESGRLLWKNQPEPHESTKLTGSPVVHDGVVYVPAASWEETRPQNPEYTCCTFRGSVTAMRVADGSQIWKTFLIPEEPRATGNRMRDGRPEWGPSGAGVWSAPTLDLARGRLYVTTGNSYTLASEHSDAVVALDLASGKIVWSRQVTPNDIFNAVCLGGGQRCPGPDFDFGSSAILVRSGGRDVLLAGQKSGVVYALDPDKQGKILWEQRVGKGGTNGGVQWGMAADGLNVYASVSDIGRVRPAQKNRLDPRPNGVDPNLGGGLTALRIRDGKKVWFAAPAPCDPAKPVCSPAQPAAVTAVPGAVFSGSMDGHLRAFSTSDGRILWDFDTAKEWTTVNGVQARGGSLDGAGPVVAGGMLFVHSGYARNGGMPGNVLLAWGVE
jgi:polyvinyl alcohol dehydrogenase (cytochrome)